MSERKVLNKYIPPDFDPDALKKHKKVLKSDGFGKKESPLALKLKYGNSKLLNIRMMYPFTFRCENCRDFTYVGTKFNSRVQRLDNDTYLGIVKWRFFGKCPNCKHEIVFKTDPKNGDYTLESGGTRTYDANRDARLAAEELDKQEDEKNEFMDTTEKMAEKADHAFAEYEELERLTALKRRAGRMRERENLAELTLQNLQSKKLEFEKVNEDELELFKKEQSEIYNKYCEPMSLDPDDGSDQYSDSDHSDLDDLSHTNDETYTDNTSNDNSTNTLENKSQNSQVNFHYQQNNKDNNTSNKDNDKDKDKDKSSSNNKDNKENKQKEDNKDKDTFNKSNFNDTKNDNRLYVTNLKVKVKHKEKKNTFTFEGYDSEDD